jgi:hypothetical protein
MERIGADAEAAGKSTLARTGLSDGTAITPSLSWSSFFQLSNRLLKVRFRAFERSADAAVLPTRAGVMPRRFSSAAVTW